MIDGRTQERLQDHLDIKRCCGRQSVVEIAYWAAILGRDFTVECRSYCEHMKASPKQRPILPPECAMETEFSVTVEGRGHQLARIGFGEYMRRFGDAATVAAGDWMRLGRNPQTDSSLRKPPYHGDFRLPEPHAGAYGKLLNVIRARLTTLQIYEPNASALQRLTDESPEAARELAEFINACPSPCLPQIAVKFGRPLLAWALNLTQANSAFVSDDSQQSPPGTVQVHTPGRNGRKHFLNLRSSLTPELTPK